MKRKSCDNIAGLCLIVENLQFKYDRRNDPSRFLIKEKSPNLTIRGVSSVSTFKLCTCLKLTLTYRLHLVKHFRVTCPITTNFGSGFMVSNLQTHPPVLNFKGGPSTNDVKKQSHVSHKSVSILPHSPICKRSSGSQVRKPLPLYFCWTFSHLLQRNSLIRNIFNNLNFFT